MKKTLYAGLALLASLSLQAQSPEHYLNIDLGGGIHRLLSDPSPAIRLDHRPGYSFQVGYTYFVFPSWGLQTGIGLRRFATGTTINLQSAELAIDQLDRMYVYNTRFVDWEERQQAVFLTVPLAVKFRTPVGAWWDFTAGLGASLDVTAYNRYQPTGFGYFETTGYYSEWNLELRDLPEYGFTTHTNVPKGELPVSKVSCSAIANLGFLCVLTDRLSLYLGGYATVGLTNLRTDASSLIYRADGSYHGVFSARDAATIRPFSVGLNIGLYINLSNPAQQE